MGENRYGMGAPAHAGNLCMGRRYELPAALATALVELLGPAVRQVEIFERSLYARCHCAAVTTRPNRIYVAGPGDAFAANLGLVLHEYCHVLRQWAPGRLSRTGYVLECLRRGYWRNRFEVEAREFACSGLPRLAALVAGEQQRLAQRGAVPPRGGAA